MVQVRRNLASGSPLDLLAEVSGLLSVVDPRSEDPLTRNPDRTTATPTLEELITSFADIDRLETTAFLAVLAQMCEDDIARARARRALNRRKHTLPDWLVRLAEIHVYRVVEMVHVLGDGDDIMLGIHLPAGEELSVIVYIDHNMGTVVKDAFVIPGPLAELIEFMKTKKDDIDTSWSDLFPADARTRITDAIDLGAMTFPPLETDTWPACRPLVEWIIRLLPEGGTGYTRPEWSERTSGELTSTFFASIYGSPLDDTDHRQLLESFLWFGTDYGPGDPLRWSPVACEILLMDWIPRKIVADSAYLSRAPDLLRAFVRFCHAQRRIRPKLTDETIEAIDRFEAGYQHIIRSPRPQVPEALLAAMGVLDVDDEWDLDDEDEDEEFQAIALGWLADAVGGFEALNAIDDQPLPDEPFSWAQIADDIRDRVQEVLTLCDRYCDEVLDNEHRTACRRLLSRIATGDPNVFRRRGRIESTASAVCWIVGKVNNAFNPYGGGRRVMDLALHFGVPQSGVSQKAGTLIRAAGFSDVRHFGQLNLGSPSLLVSLRRRQLMERRDRLGT